MSFCGKNNSCKNKKHATYFVRTTWKDTNIYSIFFLFSSIAEPQNIGVLVYGNPLEYM